MSNRLGLATIISAPVVVRAGQLNRVWRARALTDDGESVGVYLKQLAPSALLAECVGSLLARACGLGAPRPLLVSDPQQRLGATDGLPLFGLEEVDNRSMRQWIEDGEDIAVQEALMAWSNLRACCVLDEAIANIDRHAGNLLWDGDEAFVPIDHDFSLGGPLRHPMVPVKPYETVQNQLAERLTTHFGPRIEAARLEKAAQELVEQWRLIDLRALTPEDFGRRIGASNWMDDVLGLIESRIANAARLLRQRARDYQQNTLQLDRP